MKEFVMSKDSPIVSTPKGKLRGFRFDGVDHFYGIRYAKAKRFQMPEPVPAWEGVKDATGDTMNGGEIIVHGSSGDATGYAMRGGSIYIERDAGYRCGIHMKEYQQKVPAIVIGGRCGSFLGEYQAGGTIVVLGIGWEDRCPVGNFCGTGMHGGRIYLRTTHLPPDLPAQVVVSQATEEDISHLRPLVEEYCRRFQVEKEPLLASHYYVLRPNTKNPYKQLYVNN